MAFWGFVFGVFGFGLNGFGFFSGLFWGFVFFFFLGGGGSLFCLAFFVFFVGLLLLFLGLFFWGGGVLIWVWFVWYKLGKSLINRFDSGFGVLSLFGLFWFWVVTCCDCE